MKYAIIKNPNNCLPYTGTSVEGVPANREEWEKHNFYPTYEVVGQVIIVNGITVLKVEDGVFVPMDGGLEEITETEYLKNQGNWRKLRNSSFHSVSHLQEYIDSKFNRLPEPGILLSKANYYLEVFRKQCLDHKEQAKHFYQQYRQELVIDTELPSLPFNSASLFLAERASRAIENGGGKKDDYKFVAWVVGLLSEAYVSAFGSSIGLEFESVFREVFISYIKASY